MGRGWLQTLFALKLTKLLSLFCSLSFTSLTSSAQTLKRSPTMGLGTVRACMHQPQIRWLVQVASHIRQFDSFTTSSEMKFYSFTWLRNKSSPSWGNMSHSPCWFCGAENACCSAPVGCLCWVHLGAARGMKFRALYVFGKSILYLFSCPSTWGTEGWWKGGRGG